MSGGGCDAGTQQGSDELLWRVRIEFSICGREEAAAVGVHFWENWAQCITQPGTTRTWFPCAHRASHRATYAFRVTVPPNLMAVCSGQLKQQVRYSHLLCSTVASHHPFTFIVLGLQIVDPDQRYILTLFFLCLHIRIFMLDMYFSCLWMCKCMCVYMHTCISVCVCVFACSCVCVCVSLRVCVRSYVLNLP
jgi:hypothetical protein